MNTVFTIDEKLMIAMYEEENRAAAIDSIDMMVLPVLNEHLNVYGESEIIRQMKTVAESLVTKLGRISDEDYLNIDLTEAYIILDDMLGEDMGYEEEDDDTEIGSEKPQNADAASAEES